MVLSKANLREIAVTIEIRVACRKVVGTFVDLDQGLILFAKFKLPKLQYMRLLKMSLLGWHSRRFKLTFSFRLVNGTPRHDWRCQSR